MSVLKKHYKDVVRKHLQDQFSYINCMQVPKLVKIIISMGVAKVGKDRGSLQDCENELKMISGQKPIISKSRKSIANFKMREGHPTSVMVTLRGDRMWDFFYKFINISSPRIRDFRGFKKVCDGRGNYTLGIQDQQIFPEVDLDSVRRVQGMHITFVTSAKTDKECFELLKSLGMPFQH